MNSNPQNRSRTFAIVFLSVCGILIAILIWALIDSTRLKVVSTDPANKGSITADSVLVITFNRDIDTASITLEPEAGYQTVASGKTVTLVPYSTFQKDTTYTYTITQATSLDGKSTAGHKGSFTVSDTATRSELNQEASREFNIEERTALKYPFLRDLNHEDKAFSMTVRIEPKPYTNPIYDKKAYKDLTLLVQLRPESLAGPLRGQALTDELTKSRAKAITYIQQIGLNPTDFIIEFTPNVDDVD